MKNLRPSKLAGMLLLLVMTNAVLAEETEYQAKIRRLHQQLQTLDVERTDYRKAKPGLPPGKEAERERLAGQLLIESPMWKLAEQVEADLQALSDVPTGKRSGSHDRVMDELKEFLVIIHNAMDVPDTEKQADEYATALRQLISMRDLDGANAWAREHLK